MKHRITVPTFTFNKIFDGSKKVDVRIFDKTTQKIRLNDTILYQDINSDKQAECIVKGIVLFENFEELIEHIPSELIGYDNKTEVIVRLKRVYPDKFRLSFFACGLFIDHIPDKEKEREKSIKYLEDENIDTNDIRVRMKKSEHEQKKQMTFAEERLLYGIHNYQHD